MRRLPQHNLRLFTRVAIITGSATGSITELLSTELLALLSFGSEHSSFICLLSSAIGLNAIIRWKNNPNLHNVAKNI